MERYIAVDNVCAWPNLTLMPDGSVAAVIFNQPTHGGWEGDVDCWASEDGGRTWRLRGTPARHEPGTNRMNVAAGLAHNGDLIVLSSGWSHRPPVGKVGSFEGSRVLAPWVCRSADGGRTWRVAEGMEPCGCEQGPIPFGDVVRLADGRLGVSAYASNRPRDDVAFFYDSEDDGRTWRLRSVIEEGANETALTLLPDGRLLAAARTHRDQHLDLAASEDGGRTWAPQCPLTLPMQHPGHLLPLADGRLLLVYGIRNEGLRGVGGRTSADAGRTWSPPSLLADLQGAADIGYPASVQTSDGAVVTAYYCGGIPAHQRYHMGVLIWKP